MPEVTASCKVQQIGERYQENHNGTQYTATMSQWESVFGKDIISKVFSLDMEIKQTAMIALSTEIVSIIKSQFKERVKIPTSLFHKDK